VEAAAEVELEVAPEGAAVEAEPEVAEGAEVEVEPAEAEAGAARVEVALEVAFRPSSPARSSRRPEAPLREVAFP
jgi:hypothetical protein